MISKKKIIKPSRARKKVRYFIIMYAANKLDIFSFSDSEKTYLHGEFVHISIYGSYPIRRYLVNKIQRTDGVHNVIITNIIELSRTDFKTWVRND